MGAIQPSVPAPVVSRRSQWRAGHFDVLDHVLDKGIVIDAWMRVWLVGLDVLTVEARVVVASIETYLKHAEAVSDVPSCSRSGITSAQPPRRQQAGRSTPVRARFRGKLPE